MRKKGKIKHCDRCSYQSAEGLVVTDCAYCGCHQSSKRKEEKQLNYVKVGDVLFLPKDLLIKKMRNRMSAFVKTKCRHTRLKVRKHRENYEPCLHCLECGVTWSDPRRALYHLKTYKSLLGILKY